MQNIDNLVSSLDAQVLGTLGAFRLSDSFLAWGRELPPILSESYWSMVRRTKDDIRAVAQGFRQTYKVDRLLHHLRDINDRTLVLRAMLLTVGLISSREVVGSSRIDPQELRRMKDEVPALRNTFQSVMNKFSTWQEELDACVDVFSLLDEPMEAVELLLSSLSSTIPDTYLAHGNALMERLVRLWSDRRLIAAQAIGLASDSPELQRLVGRLVDQREDQGSVLRAIAGLFDQVREPPPLYFLNQSFTARQFSGANWLFRRLDLGRSSIIEDVEHLETTLDHFLDVITGPEA